VTVSDDGLVHVSFSKCRLRGFGQFDPIWRQLPGRERASLWELSLHRFENFLDFACELSTACDLNDPALGVRGLTVLRAAEVIAQWSFRADCTMR
jgi:hypothetical protein